MMGNLRYMRKKEKIQIGLWFITNMILIISLLYMSSLL